MSAVSEARLDAIDRNPFRQLGQYPFVERKIEALMRSYEEVGMWPGVIARKRDNRYQIAFGHHRIEAAKRFGLKTVTLIVEELSDKEMLQYMGRENMEDYNADFLTMLETWEAAVGFVSPGRVEKPKGLDIARLLGWTRKVRAGEAGTKTAEACASASALIAGGHITRNDLRNLAVRDVLEVCQRAQARIDWVDKTAKQTSRPARESEAVKRAIGRGAAAAAQDVREGRVAQRDIRGHVDVRAYRAARDAKTKTPLFAAFGRAVSNQITKFGNGDQLAERLNAMEKAIPKLEMEEDKQIIDRIAFDCGQLEERFGKRKNRFLKAPAPVVKLVRSRPL